MDSIRLQVRRVLVIDDQESIHEAFRKVLRPSTPDTTDLDLLEGALFGTPDKTPTLDVDFEIEFAHQGKEGYEIVRESLEQEQPFGVAFVDMRMPPGWDGLETIRNLWQLDPKLQVVVCTAYSDHVWKDVCRELGKVDQLLLLNKPFSNEYALSLACALTEKRLLMERLHAELTTAQEANRRLEDEIKGRKSAEDSLRKMATLDVLTGLPNRAVLIEQLRKCLRLQYEGSDGLDAVLFLDIDNFKLINDSLGHSTGDKLLVQFAGRLAELRSMNKNHTSSSNSIHRLGGDEFVVLATNLRSSDEATELASEINQALQASFDIPGCFATISTSIGIAMIDRDSVNPEQILRNADTAMYRAKQSGKDQYAIFDEEMHQSVLARLTLENSLRSAVENHEFELHYQPILSLETKQTVGFEALVRWPTQEGNWIPPLDFIPVAEDTGLILPLGRWILEQACQDFAVWKLAHPDTQGCTISVNVSKRQLTEPSFVDHVLRSLDDAGLVQSDLNLEVTESTVMNSPELIVERLEALHGCGMKIHMDDFGTGRSSLSCLHQFPIDVLKIDQSFISSMGLNAEYTATVEAILVLGKSLGIKVVAEGIETHQQMEQLAALDCEFGQGYFFAKPAPAAEAFSLRSVALADHENSFSFTW